MYERAALQASSSFAGEYLSASFNSPDRLCRTAVLFGAYDLKAISNLRIAVEIFGHYAIMLIR